MPNARPIVPTLRTPKFSYAELPRDWFAGNPLMSSMGNALHLLFPAGEQFFVRSVMAYKDQLKTDPELWKRVRGFAGQEGRHGHEHERTFEELRKQGVPVDAFLKVYTTLAFSVLERAVSSRRIRLATTVAAEHYTALLARMALGEQGMLDAMHPAMEDLLRWHALEELEHQDVTFDVLRHLGLDSIPLRAAGLFFISIVLFPFWIGGGLAFMAKRDEGFLRAWRRSTREPLQVLPFGAMFGAALELLRPGFVPGKPGDAELLETARAWFAERQATAAAA